MLTYKLNFFFRAFILPTAYIFLLYRRRRHNYNHHHHYYHHHRRRRRRRHRHRHRHHPQSIFTTILPSSQRNVSLTEQVLPFLFAFVCYSVN